MKIGREISISEGCVNGADALLVGYPSGGTPDRDPSANLGGSSKG